MAFAPELSVVFFSLLAAASWGSGDFSGSVASRRMSVASVLAISHPVGLVLLLILARINGEVGIEPNDWIWGLVAGAAGGIALAMLYRALATGRAGVVAPVTSIIATSLPVIVGITTAGLPGDVTLIGFGLAFVSVLLVSASGAFATSGLALALGAGLGFGVFFIMIARLESDAVFLPLAVARLASSTLMLTIALGTRRIARPSSLAMWGAILLAGTLDVVGNMFFSLAERSGRLDIAGVVSSLYPAVTITWAFLLRGERIGRWQLIGIVLGLVAVALIAL
ncbi:MAG: DMT family transporter [Anaerolineae bacterium]|nr:DMT family transporter [Anaerolineae bacterium]